MELWMYNCYCTFWMNWSKRLSSLKRAVYVVVGAPGPLALPAWMIPVTVRGTIGVTWQPRPHHQQVWMKSEWRTDPMEASGKAQMDPLVFPSGGGDVFQVVEEEWGTAQTPGLTKYRLMWISFLLLLKLSWHPCLLFCSTLFSRSSGSMKADLKGSATVGLHCCSRTTRMMPKEHRWVYYYDYISTLRITEQSSEPTENLKCSLKIHLEPSFILLPNHICPFK